MTFYEIKKHTRNYYPVIALDRIVPASLRRLLIVVLGLLLFLLILPSIFHFAPFLFGESIYDLLIDYLIWFEVGVGVFFIIFPIWFIAVALQGFFNSYYFRHFEGTLKEKKGPGELAVSFEVAVLSFYADEDDMTASVLGTSYGQTLFLRSGLLPDEVRSFVAGKRDHVSSHSLVVESGLGDGRIRFPDVALALYRADKDLSAFLFSKKIREQDFLEAARWLSADVTRSKKKNRWWGKDALGRIPGIGKDWAYGGTWSLKKYASELTAMLLPSLESRPAHIRHDVDRMEATLSKAVEANVIIVGEDGGNKQDVLLGLVSRIQEGKVFPVLEHKKVFEVDTNKLVSASGTRTNLEKELLGILNESVKAGNIILVIPDMASFVRSVSELGGNVASLLDPYLLSSKIQIIALASPVSFHQTIEPVGALLDKFDVLMVKEGGVGETLETLEEEAEKIEAIHGILFSVPTLVAVVESADRYVTEGVMPDKAVDLFYEVAGVMQKKQRAFVTTEDVFVFVKERTGIPTGSVSESEKETLMNLENVLHQRVVGQDEAVNAIASAMKRARAGLTNPNRPMGSFLFLGPTGVGKTETTKALAASFFGDENKILRFDMSEYNGDDALSKLIGSFESKSPGVLSSMLRERPYGVLLLDEFEKANKKVMDLFLQILDEGFFSDMYGQKINARNLIIIATSNAGSDLIYEAVKRGGNLGEKKSEIVDAIVRDGVYRPELINRFDGVILFHPIDSVHLKKIAALMLERLGRRLAARGYELVINNELLEFLVKFGSDPKFGARPMNRAIQDKIEQRIADKIIKNELVSGQKIEFSQKDLESFY